MTEIRNGVSADGLPVVWRKSSFSGAVGNCVELGWLHGGKTGGVRNSRDPHGSVLVVPAAAVVSFVSGIGDRRA